MVLTAAFLGWMFDGLEMGLFPLAGRPALQELLHTTDDRIVSPWFGVAIAAFLVGAATGGVVFGWLGDRFGRVRSLSLSVLAYALFTGLGYFVQAPWQIVVLRFVAALGMGGEWSLGVALITETWPDRSRTFLAGLIGAASNVGFLAIAAISLFVPPAPGSWRILMIVGAAPALLTFFIQMLVPESERWQREQSKGATSHWATRDLLGVLIGAAGACLILVLWAADVSLWLRLPGTVVGLVVALLGFLYPVLRYLQRALPAQDGRSTCQPVLVRMLLGAGLSGVALLGTWGSIQWAPTWADQLSRRDFETTRVATTVSLAVASPGVGPLPALAAYNAGATYHPEGSPKEWTQIWLAIGAIVGTLLAAFAGDWLGRRWTYLLLCVGSLLAILAFYRLNVEFGSVFLFWAFIAGGVTASFYGWLPLYLPELFRTGVRATGQGFSFNFGRILAAVGALQTGALTRLFGGDYPLAASVMGLVYLVGMGLIWLGPETKGQPLPE
jgi:MFS family permease